MSLEIIFQIIAILIPLVFAITVHEVAHGFIARGFGDFTADRQGRLTLNPIAHIDPVPCFGSIGFTIFYVCRVKSDSNGTGPQYRG